jgi:hypothetical protein
MDTIEQIRTAIFSAYDLQKLRIQTGNRLAINFRAKLGGPALKSDDEEDAEALKVLEELRKSWRRLTDGVARNRTLPSRRGFVGDELISDYAELALVNSYIQLERQEDASFGIIETLLEGVPIWETWLKGLRGVGPATAGVLLAYFDPHKAPNVSKFWSYAGLDVAADGRARGRFQEHLVERQYQNKAGATSTRMSVTYNPWLKSRLLGMVGPTFLKTGSPYRAEYDRYKHGIESDPDRIKLPEAEKQKRLKEEADPAVRAALAKRLWSPGRIHRASMRYMVKRFLADFWERWRKLEGLPTPDDYNETRRGRKHGEGDAEAA